MNKTLVALAVGSVISASAFADIAVGPFVAYGTMQSAVELITIAPPTGVAITNTSSISQNRLMDQTSKLGFKIAHDLGDGLTGLAQVESRVYLGNGGDNTQDKAEVGSRNTFAGLTSTTWGTVRLGRYDNAYKLSQKIGSPFYYNNVNDASAEYGDKQIMGRLGARGADTVAYESPKIAGMTLLASYNMGKDSDNGLKAGSFVTPGAAAAATSTYAGNLMPQTALALGYANGPLTASLGYTMVANAAWQLDASSATKAVYNTVNGSGMSLDATLFAIQYVFDAYSIGAVFENTKSALSGVAAASNFNQSQVTYALVAAYKSGPNEFHIRYANAADVGGNTGNGNPAIETGASQFSLMYAYEFNKSVKGIASYTGVNNKKNASFTSASNFSMTKGATMDQIAVGLAASF